MQRDKVELVQNLAGRLFTPVPTHTDPTSIELVQMQRGCYPGPPDKKGIARLLSQVQLVQNSVAKLLAWIQLV